MKAYIVRLPNQELKIFTVQPEQEAAFLQEHGSGVLASGNSIQEVLMQFARLKAEEPSTE